jgi:hypothetical protein
LVNRRPGVNINLRVFGFPGGNRGEPPGYGCANFGNSAPLAPYLLFLKAEATNLGRIPVALLAMKKTTKATKTLTPAKKPAKTIRKAPEASIAKPVASAAKPPPVKPAAPKAVVTTISANFDVGFGNALYIRGEGFGLSWDKGTRMDCVDDSTWTIAFGESVRPAVFKFLINDEVWSGGEDYRVQPGTTLALTPVFPGW